MNAPPTGAGAQAGQGSKLPGPAVNTAGPHRHDVLNKLDPTVDSQSGGAQVLGPGINASSQGARAATNPLDAQPGVETSNNRGPQHISRIANVLDPRIDSSQTKDAVPTGSAAAPGVSAPAATNATQGTYGAQSNTVDPQRQAVGAQPGIVTQPGPAPTTAGPHRHDILNKLDPTVDSNAAAQPTMQQAQYRNV